jgi:tyrosyl-tRNA synthetase
MEAKKQLGFRIVERYHSRAAADAALADFETRFSKRDLEHAELPTVALTDIAPDLVSIVVAAYAQGFQMTRTRSDARRLIEQGSVQINGQKLTDPKAVPDLKTGDVLRLDKTRAVRIA